MTQLPYLDEERISSGPTCKMGCSALQMDPVIGLELSPPNCVFIIRHPWTSYQARDTGSCDSGFCRPTAINLCLGARQIDWEFLY